MLEPAAFGSLVSGGAVGLVATQLPVLILREPLRLVGHIARANTHWQVGAVDGLMLIQSSDAYVSPSFYPSKAKHGRVVPTWNYEAIHLYGAIEWFEDRSRLLGVVEGLTRCFERDREKPWAVSDAPPDYIDAMLRAIVGMEFRVSRIEAVRKLSQNRDASDRAGVIAGLSASSLDSDRAVAKAMKS